MAAEGGVRACLNPHKHTFSYTNKQGTQMTFTVSQSPALSPLMFPEEEKVINVLLKVNVGFALVIKLIIHAPHHCYSPVC